MNAIILAALLAQAGAALAEPPAAVAAGAIAAKAGTPLRLMVWNEVSTRSVKVGDRFLLVLDSPLIVAGQMLIPRGANAWGDVVAARQSGMAGRAGTLETKLLHLETPAGPVPITTAAAASLADKGRNGALQMIMVTAALTPWGPFARGNNARLKAGHVVEAVLGADLPGAAPPP